MIAHCRVVVHAQYAPLGLAAEQPALQIIKHLGVHMHTGMSVETEEANCGCNEAEVGA